MDFFFRVATIKMYGPHEFGCENDEFMKFSRKKKADSINTIAATHGTRSQKR